MKDQTNYHSFYIQEKIHGILIIK